MANSASGLDRAELDDDDASPLTAGKIVLDQRINILGSVDIDGEVVLSGAIEGDVRCTRLHISRTGLVNGNIVAEETIVAGEVAGTIYSDVITLKTDSAVEGEIYHGKLILEQGCYFEGKSRRVKDPLELAPLSPFEEPEDETVEEPNTQASATVTVISQLHA